MEKLSKNDISKIVKMLKEDKVIAMPTDTIYGFSCLATSDIAIQKIYKFKQRNNSKQFILLVSKDFDLKQLINASPEIFEFIKNNSPAPLTMIVEKNTSAKLSPSFLLPTLAIRIPDNSFLQAILKQVGFLVSTSCNLEGQPNLNNPKEIEKTFLQLDGIVVSKQESNLKPSTIVDLTKNPYEILRQGDYEINNINNQTLNK